jgi:hypothetical protein
MVSISRENIFPARGRFRFRFHRVKDFTATAFRIRPDRPAFQLAMADGSAPMLAFAQG